MHLYCVVEVGQLDFGPCKIGIAVNPLKRMSNLQAGNWRRLELAWAIEAASQDDAISLERFLLGMLRPSMFGPETRKRLCSEWVETTPALAREAIQPLLDAIKADRAVA